MQQDRTRIRLVVTSSDYSANRDDVSSESYNNHDAESPDTSNHDIPSAFPVQQGLESSADRADSTVSSRPVKKASLKHWSQRDGPLNDGFRLQRQREEHRASILQTHTKQRIPNEVEIDNNQFPKITKSGQRSQRKDTRSARMPSYLASFMDSNVSISAESHSVDNVAHHSSRLDQFSFSGHHQERPAFESADMYQRMMSDQRSSNPLPDQRARLPRPVPYANHDDANRLQQSKMQSFGQSPHALPARERSNRLASSAHPQQAVYAPIPQYPPHYSVAARFPFAQESSPSQIAALKTSFLPQRVHDTVSDAGYERTSVLSSTPAPLRRGMRARPQAQVIDQTTLSSSKRTIDADDNESYNSSRPVKRIRNDDTDAVSKRVHFDEHVSTSAYNTTSSIQRLTKLPPQNDAPFQAAYATRANRGEAVLSDLACFGFEAKSATSANDRSGNDSAVWTTLKRPARSSDAPELLEPSQLPMAYKKFQPVMPIKTKTLRALYNFSLPTGKAQSRQPLHGTALGLRAESSADEDRFRSTRAQKRIEKPTSTDFMQAGGKKRKPVLFHPDSPPRKPKMTISKELSGAALLNLDTGLPPLPSVVAVTDDKPKTRTSVLYRKSRVPIAAVDHHPQSHSPDRNENSTALRPAMASLPSSPPTIASGYLADAPTSSPSYYNDRTDPAQYSASLNSPPKYHEPQRFGELTPMSMASAARHQDEFSLGHNQSHESARQLNVPAAKPLSARWPAALKIKFWQ